MGQIKWYKRDPDAALSGMMGLSLEERGAYNTVLDLIYTRDGNLPDDERFIAGWLGVDVRVWKRIKERLISLGKLRVEAGNLRNSRADVEVSNALSRVGSARDAGKASARKRGGKYERSSPENSNLASTDVETGAATAVPTNHSHNHNKKEEPDGSSARDACERVATAWNSMAEPIGLAKCTSITPKRMPALKARLRDTGIDAILRAIEHVPKSSFLRGDRGDWSGCTIDFLLKPDGVTRILEGKYDDRSKSPESPRDHRDGFTQAIDRRLGLGADGSPAGASG